MLGAGGVVLRYGRFYGPDTYFEHRPPPPPRIHIDEAARHTVSALDTPPGVLAIVENEVDHGRRLAGEMGLLFE